MAQHDFEKADRRMGEFVSLLRGIFCDEDLNSFGSTEPDFLLSKVPS